MKSCKKCKIDKPLDDFPKSSSHKDGKHPMCSVCRNTYVQEYRVRSGRTAGAIKPKGTYISKADSKMFYTYGIRVSEAFSMFVEQKGVCKICKHGPESTRNNGHKHLAIDHCHTTGKVRGLLCMSCNVSLGAFEDNIEYLRSSIEYLEQQ